MSIVRFVRMSRLAGAARVAPSNPIGALGTVLALPNREALLDAIDEEAAGAERLAAMRCARRAGDCDVTDAKGADAVCGGHTHSGDFVAELLEDPRELGLGHRAVGFVLEQRHRVALVLIAHDTDEGRHGAGAGVSDRLGELIEGERLCANAPSAHEGPRRK